ncbi:MAG: tat pathway signal sequence [Segniliparus sp.]|uniref:tat pathway signal sequence n=1 Tax=Segniliparus sp. TaxID=2804064 RepID=UPI003F31A0FA
MRPTSQTHALPPWWMGALGALGLGAYVAVADLPLTKRERFLARAALVAGSAAGAATLAPEMLLLTPDQVSRMPLSRQAGAAVAFAASLCTSPVLGDRLVDGCAAVLSARGTSWPRARLGALVTMAALLGEFLQRFPPPPTPKTPPPKRRLVRPSSETIMRN